MAFDNSFWNSKDVDNMYDLDNAENEILHPHTAKLINSQQQHKTMLDFGCGNAFLSTLIREDIEITLFDKNADTVEQLRKKRAKPNIKIEATEQGIPLNYFDCVVCCQVIMCIETKEELLALFSKLHSYKKENGKLILVITHPCFLQYEYGHWCTSYSKGQPFYYLKEGEPYQVYMKKEGTTSVSFTDYNWSLGCIINISLEAGFVLDEIVELKDAPYKNNTPNSLYPHYMYLIYS